MRKKKVGLFLGILAFYFVIVGMIYYDRYFGRHSDGANLDFQPETEVQDTPSAEDEGREPEEQEAPMKDFVIPDNDLMYAGANQTGMYLATEDILVMDEDMRNILKRYGLPSLVRMAEEDAENLMKNLQVLRRIEVMGIDTEEFTTPEYNWKAIYSDSLVAVRDALSFEDTVSFYGTRASELNAFLQNEEKHDRCVIDIRSTEIELDETIRVPSNVVLKGNGVKVGRWPSWAETESGTDGSENSQGTSEDSRRTYDGVLEYGMLLEDAENVGVYGMNFVGGYRQGIYVIRSNRVLFHHNEMANAECKALCVMGNCENVNIVNNSIHDNGNGAVFFDGEITGCIIQGNSVYENRGTRNLTAGIVLCSVELENIYDPYNEFKDVHLYDILESPHDNVIISNHVQSNYSSGIYSDSGYRNYIIDNLVEDNEKEGMCLDYGSFGCYVCGNTIRRNGHRNRQTDGDLEADFILGAGRLPDGSSTAKLPGISLDNAAYNIVYQNIVSDNDGSGVKSVRSCYRNVILSNVITNNNQGVNDFFHGFGVEIGHASTPDEPVKGLDFTACYENIVARNVVSGPHYSGIYMATDTYCNDLIDNVLMECGLFSIENHSAYFNSAVGNVFTKETLDFVQQ